MTLCRPVPRAIAAIVAAGSWWFVAAVSPVLAAAPPGRSAADPAGVAREVFQGQDYWWKRIETRTVSTSWLESILRAIFKAIGDLLAAIFDRIGWILRAILRRLFGFFTGDFSAGTLSLWVIILILLAWSAWKLAPVIVRWLSGRAPGPRTQEGVVSLTLPEATDLFDQAGQAFRDQMYAEAIRLALLALIARLEKEGRLRYDTTRTNREYQRELRDSTELAACFGRLARVYERVWYGRISAERADAEQAISLCGSVINGERP